MLENCTCKKIKCERHGECKECIEYHNNGKRVPYCKRNKLINNVLKKSQKYSSRQMFLLFLPILLLISTLAAYKFFVYLWDFKLGYLFGFIFYWILWCLLIPYLIIGKKGFKDLFKKATYEKKEWLHILLLIIPVLLAILFGPFFSRITQVSIGVGVLSFILAVINAISEEILWRGVYISIFPKNYFLGYIYPAIGFAIWHISPNTVNPSSLGIIPFIMGAGFIGICWGLVAFRTKTIRWTIICHIILDFSGFGALFYIS